MNRLLSCTLLLVGLLHHAAAQAQDYSRAEALQRGEARTVDERQDRRRPQAQRDHGEYWNRQPENYWERDARRVREQGSRLHGDDSKHARHADSRWQVERGLPHSDPRYRHNRYDRAIDHRSDWRSPEWRSRWHHGWSGYRYRAPIRYHYPQGYSRYHWRVGYTLPTPFLLSSWHVDYRPYGIAPPPRGLRWVRVDGDLLLVELATGYIVDVLYDFYY
jgi:Ni/Co efflux regulator RcnB